MLILANACFSGAVVAQTSMNRAVGGESSSISLPFQIIQLVLTCFFVIAWTFRLAAYGSKFFTCRDKGWHIFDTIVVAISTIDIITGLIEKGEGGASVVTSIRNTTSYFAFVIFILVQVLAV